LPPPAASPLACVVVIHPLAESLVAFGVFGQQPLKLAHL
jgi:hypothetical protein